MSARAAILAQVLVLRAQADTLEALAKSLPEAEDGVSDCRAHTLDSAAELTGVSAHTLRSWARSGRLASYRGARGAYLVTRAQLDAAITARPSAPRPAPAPTLTDLDAWERAADATLRLVRGRP